MAPPTDVLVASPSSSAAAGAAAGPTTTNHTPIPANCASLQRIRRARERWEASKKKLRPVEQGGEGRGVVSPLAPPLPPPPSPSSFRSPRRDAKAAITGSSGGGAGIGGSAAKEDKAVDAVAKGSAGAAVAAPVPATTAPAQFTFSMSPPSSSGAKPAVKIDFGVASKADSWGGSKSEGAGTAANVTGATTTALFGAKPSAKAPAASSFGAAATAGSNGGGGSFSSVKVPTATGVVTEEGATPTPSTAFSFGGGSIGGTGGTAGFGAAGGSAVSRPLFGAPAPAPAPLFGASSPAPAPLFGAATAEKKSDGKSEDKEKTEEAARTDYHAKLVAFYTKHNPSKLSTVDKTLESYKGKENVLFQKLERKYCPSAATTSAPVEVALPPGVLPPPPVGEVKDSRPTVYLDLTLGGETLGRVTIQLYTDLVPLASENFRALCTGEKGNGRSSSKPLHYKGCSFHRIVPNFVVQGGDFTKHNGTGGESIYAGTEHGDMWGKFKDEKPFLGHTRKGLLSMANNGPNANGSQFFITLRRTPHLDGKHVVFGCVTEGMEFVDTMVEKTVRDKAGKPTGETKVVINDCGEIGGKKKATSEVAQTTSADTSAPAPTSAFSFGAKLAGSSSFSFGATTKPPAFSFAKAPVPALASAGGDSAGEKHNKKEPAPASAVSSAPKTVSASAAFPPMSAAPPKNPFSAPKAAAASNPAPAPASASIFGSSSAAPSFGSGNAPTFGSRPTPVFGSSSTPLFGSSSAPTFGSGSAPPFGSGSAPAFGSSFGSSTAKGATGGGGFAALASSPAKSTAFGGFGTTDTSGSTGFSLGSFTARTDPSMVKPLFDATTSAHNDTPTVKAADNESENEQENPAAEKEDDEVYSDDLIGTADTARTAYDEIAEGATSLPSSRFDDLLDVVGEGFYGDEKDEQLAIIDPSSTGTITKKAFVSWYVNFVTAADADDDESASLDTADREEREEERQNADQAFTDTVGEGVDVIDSAAFGDLIESMGTTYCEEEHRRTIKKISGADGKISRDAFIAWYLDWLFGGDESDIETDEEDEAGEEEERPATSGGEGWGNAFGVEEGSWKCDACMVRNKAGDTKCAACETVRPGYEDKQEESSDSAAASGSAIGAGGFSFGGGASTAAAAAPSIGSGGFSFGGATTSAPAPAPAPVTAVSSGGGFSFGAKPSSTATSSTTGGFSFGAPPAPAGKVPDKAEKKKDEKAVSSSSASFPPLATKAPTPFSATAKASAAAPAATTKPAASSSAFPPMSTAAPKNPFSATAKAPVAAAPAPAPAPAAKPAASSSAFPPMSTAAPKNPFSAPSKPPAPAPAAKPAASSSAFPPMSTAAPKNPFSAPSKPPAPAPAAKPAASSSAFPPMSTAAPKNPFSAPSKPPAPAPAAKSAASSSAFPPMSTAAPKNPFASVKLTSSSATIGSTSTSGGFSFGTPSTLGGGSGAPATTKGGFSFGSTGSATFGSPPAKLEAPKATEQEKSAPIFGSGSKAPVFGSGSGVGGFAALASSPAPAGAGAGSKTSSTGFGFGFGGSSSSSTSGVSGVDSSMVKPLFGSVPAAAPAPTSEAAPAPAPAGASATDNGTDNIREDDVGVSGTAKPLSDTDEARTATAVFDSLDEGKKGRVPASMFEALTDELGEGFHGDEFDKQLAIIDPEGTGFIARSSFAAWYSELVLGGSGDGEDGSDAGSLDTEEREEREEERQNADEAFTAAAGEDVDVLAVSAFSDLIESMGTTYCEEEHRRTIKKISSEDGATISRDAFVAWYLDWLFGGDESDIESDEGEDDEDGDADGAGGTGGASSSEGWGGTFGAAEEGSWKCDACMVRNKASDAKCAACETARPGYEAKAAEVSSGDGSATASSAAAFASEIGTGGFSFGGGGSSSSTAAPAPASSSSIGAGGFSFGGNTTTSSAATPAPAFGASSAVSSSSSGGGFAFGAPATAAPAPPSGVGGGGFTFGVKPAVTSAASDKVNPDATAPSAAQQENPAAEKEDDEVYSDDLIGTADTARTAYDEIAEGATSLPSSRFDDLLDVVGEGFYGDEKDEQLAIIDPSSTGTITKKAFVSWYVNFVTAADADDDESASLDTADREEREEERQNADQAFTDTVGEGVDVIDSAAFGDLIESMGTTYCEEEHRRTIKKISGADGKISRDAFIAWYLDWLFGGDESDIETDEEDEAGEEEERPATSGGEGWGNAFGVEEGSWKCDACMVRNKAGDTKCAACETVRPGYEDKQEESSDSAAASGSAIGAGGFSFGGGASTAAAAAPSIGSGGFSFGGATTSAPAPAPAPVTAVSSGGGFSFGAKPSSTATSSTTGGFSFGAPPAPAGKVPDKAEKKKDEKAVSSSSASFPPLATKAPTPFSATAKASAAAPAATAKPAASSSAFPPMSTAAPKNPFSATAKAPVAAAPAPAPAPAAKPAASSSAFPPMSTAAPKNPFSAPSKPPAPAPAAKPAASSSAFPPMSTAAPKNPFSAPSKPPAPAPAAKPAASSSLQLRIRSPLPRSLQHQHQRPSLLLRVAHSRR